MNFGGEWDILIGWIITVLVGIIGWSLGIRQFAIYERKTIAFREEAGKKEIQIKTGDEALSRLGEVREKLFNLDKLIAELANEHGAKGNQRLLKPDRQINDIWIALEEKIASYNFFFESREIVLHNFVGSQRKLKKHQDDLTDKIHALMDQYYYNSNLNVPLNSIERDATALVEDEARGSIEKLYKTLSDYVLGLQNAFLTEMFDFRSGEEK